MAKTTFVDIWFEMIAIILALSILGHRPSKKTFSLMSGKIVLLVAIVQLFGLVVFDFGLTKASSTAVITAISASYPALTVFLALKHFDEKQTIAALAGAFVTVAGVVILSLA